jgi:predicted CoA-binding protein
MASQRESFWDKHQSFVVVGHTGKRNYPKLTYKGLRNAGKTVFAVDLGGAEVEGDKTYPDLASLPGAVEAAVLELPKDETAEWVGRAADAGGSAVGVHQQTDTPQARRLAEERGLDVCSGTCAVMYVTPGLSGHSPHRWIMKLIGKY